MDKNDSISVFNGICCRSLSLLVFASLVFVASFTDLTCQGAVIASKRSAKSQAAIGLHKSSWKQWSKWSHGAPRKCLSKYLTKNCQDIFQIIKCHGPILASSNKNGSPLCGASFMAVALANDLSLSCSMLIMGVNCYCKQQRGHGMLNPAYLMFLSLWSLVCHHVPSRPLVFGWQAPARPAVEASGLIPASCVDGHGPKSPVTCHRLVRSRGKLWEFITFSVRRVVKVGVNMYANKFTENPTNTSLLQPGNTGLPLWHLAITRMIFDR